MAVTIVGLHSMTPTHLTITASGDGGPSSPADATNATHATIGPASPSPSPEPEPAPRYLTAAQAALAAVQARIATARAAEEEEHLPFLQAGFHVATRMLSRARLFRRMRRGMGGKPRAYVHARIERIIAEAAAAQDPEFEHAMLGGAEVFTTCHRMVCLRTTPTQWDHVFAAEIFQRKFYAFVRDFWAYDLIDNDFEVIPAELPPLWDVGS
ncbi:uncharacterized protein LOC62_02G003362 [Vanrija pseudolonga]|uniref:Uncharacterized protein n=1 Tax=Vanrija pseudolonga TaxID=143232 RepID=A0AAF0Y5R0_9TREE|nr:hypothetical protein LOC62_02G003362 [Vanrija pseudolonga]